MRSPRIAYVGLDATSTVRFYLCAMLSYCTQKICGAISVARCKVSKACDAVGGVAGPWEGLLCYSTCVQLVVSG